MIYISKLQQLISIKNKQLTAIVCVMVFAIAGNLWFLGQSWTEKNVRYFLAEQNLFGHVMYDSVSSNPLSGKVSINNIKGYGKSKFSFFSNIGKLEIIDFDSGDILPKNIHIRMTDVSFNNIEAVRNGLASNEVIAKIRNPNFTEKLLFIGYQHIKTDIELKFEFNPDTSFASLDIFVSGKDIGYSELKLGFAGIGKKSARSFTDGINAFKSSFINGRISVSNKADFKKLERRLNALMLAEFFFSYKDKGLMKRYKKFADDTNWRLPKEKSPSNLTSYETRKIINDMAGYGLSVEIAEKTVETVADFIENPQTIEISTNIQKPISVSKLKITSLFKGGLKNIKGIANFLKLTNGRL
ncbi:MAG: hypothetical protein KAJ75_04135 [Alphaproteobacteria bacterium]|nr:hypothetical protein [Alphaproteobacteria bacterium]